MTSSPNNQLNLLASAEDYYEAGNLYAYDLKEGTLVGKTGLSWLIAQIKNCLNICNNNDAFLRLAKETFNNMQFDPEQVKNLNGEQKRKISLASAKLILEYNDVASIRLLQNVQANIVPDALGTGRMASRATERVRTYNVEKQSNISDTINIHFATMLESLKDSTSKNLPSGVINKQPVLSKIKNPVCVLHFTAEHGDDLQAKLREFSEQYTKEIAKITNQNKKVAFGLYGEYGIPQGGERPPVNIVLTLYTE